MAPERILGNHYHDVVSTGTIVLLVARHPTSTVSNASFISFLIGNLPAQIQHNNSPRKKKHEILNKTR
jgi:hypothetical protein